MNTYIFRFKGCYLPGFYAVSAASPEEAFDIAEAEIDAAGFSSGTVGLDSVIRPGEDMMLWDGDY